MTKTLTKKEMIAELLKVEKEFDENYLKRLDRENLEWLCEKNGIQVYIQSTNTKTYDYLIGYDFGDYTLIDIAMYGSQKQFIMQDNKDGSEYIMLYREFKNYIDGVDYPKR